VRIQWCYRKDVASVQAVAGVNVKGVIMTEQEEKRILRENIEAELVKVRKCLETEKYYNGFYKSRIKLLEETLESLKKKEDVETK
jgi:hypothetical protein